MTKKTPMLPSLTATRDVAGYVTLDLGGFTCKLPPGIDSPEIRRALILHRAEIRRLVIERARWSVGPEGVVATYPGPGPRPAARQSRPVEFEPPLSAHEPR